MVESGMNTPRALKAFKAVAIVPHDHEWQIDSGCTDGYYRVHCWCGAWAFRSFSGEVYRVMEPEPEVRMRQFEKRLMESER